MVTAIDGKNLENLLKNIKSRSGTTNLYDHLGKMYEVKKEMNDDIKYSDLFEDISIRIKKEGKYNINPSKIPKISPSQKIRILPMYSSFCSISRGDNNVLPIILLVILMFIHQS